MTSPSELVNPASFHVEVQNPYRIYHTVYDAFQRQKEFLPPSFNISSFEHGEGLLSDIDIYLDVLYPYPEGYTVNLLGRYRLTEYEYWSKEEIEKLLFLMKPHVKDINYVKTPEGLKIIRAVDSEEKTSYFVRLGFENERKKWTKQIEKVDEFLRREEYPVSKNEMEEAHQYLVKNPHPVPETSKFQIIIVGEETNLNSQNPQLLTLGSAEEFLRRIKKFRSFIERTINSVSGVKNISRKEALVIRPPLPHPEVAEL